MEKLVEVAWEITRECNLNCSHCYSKDAQQKDLDTKIIIETLYALKKIGVEKVKYGGGEPLLRKDFLEIFKTTKELGFTTTFASNGSTINESVAAQFKEIGLHKLQLSLDGMEEKHDSFRKRKGLFKKVLESISILKNYSIEVDVATTLTKENYSEMPSLLKLCRELEVRRWRIMKYIPCGNGTTELMLDPATYKGVVDYLLGEKKDEKPEIIVAREFNYICSPVDYNDMQCVGGKTFISIKANGDVTPCSFISHMVAGNLSINSLDEILNSKVMEKFANIKSYDPNCSFSESCMGGCKAAAYHSKKEFCCDPYCWVKKSK
ncbi:radical SAM protein [Candidatus Woesearchaeota archaeon]|nr:radical SAM protein [Candidatus Woesearchaeota archaeon]